MNFRTLFVGVTAAMLAILPSLAQDSAAPAETSGFIAVTGTKATLANNVLTIEGVPAALPTLVTGFDPDFYPTGDMAASWDAAVQFVAGRVTDRAAGVGDIAPEAIVVTARLMGVEEKGPNSFTDYTITLKLTNPVFDDSRNTLKLDASEMAVVSALDAAFNPIKSPRLPTRLEMSRFALYIDLTPQFLDALANGAIQADAIALGQGRPSGAKPCRPAAARRRC
jgi:hypothetical protein